MPEWKPDQRFQDALEEGVEYIKRKLGDLNYHQVIVIICAPTDARDRKSVV